MGFYNQDGSPIKSVHRGLIELIQRELGPHLAQASEFLTGPGSKGPRLQSFIEADTRLLFSYVDNAIVTGELPIFLLTLQNRNSQLSRYTHRLKNLRQRQHC